MAPHDWPRRARVAIFVAVVIGYAAVAGGAIPAGHASTDLPITVTDIRVSGLNTTDGHTFVTNLTITVHNHGDEPLSLGAFVHSERQHDYAYWLANTSTTRIRVPPGESRTVRLRAPDPSEWLTPGNIIAVSLLVENGNRRETVTRWLPATPRNGTVMG